MAATVSVSQTSQSLLLMLVTSILIGQISTQDATVLFRIPEEEQIHTYVGSVALESKLFSNFSNDRFQLLQFQILVPGNKYVGMFDIETDTSLLWTNQVIDREEFTECFESCEVDFNVAVYEKDVLEPINIIKVVVDIEDENDNKPKFVPGNEELIISESTNVNSELLRRSAVDLDQGPGNSVQTYSMFPETEIFEIETVYNDGNEFTLKLMQPLDHETVNFYQVIVLAKDGGPSQNTGSLTVDIIVTDFNDNAPEFDDNLYEQTVKENTPINTTVLFLYATDADSGTNADITFKFSGRVPDKVSTVFSINSSTGELKVAGPIDYETDQQFEFSVHAVDHGNPAKTSTAHVVISVEDINDNFPQINLNQPPGGTLLSELADLGSYAAHVEITDLDSGDNGIVKCNVLDDHFRLESLGIENNYEIVLNRSLDHEIQTSHNVTIVCQDSGDSPKKSSASFIVHVEDKNDNFPEFPDNAIFSVAIQENNEKGVTIVGITATDADSGAYGRVSYSLHPNTEHGLFIINSFTGIITANVSLDRETHGDQQIFRVLASDGGDPALVTTGTVVVSILDLNDNAPIFRTVPHVFNISENLPKDSIVGNISVYDPDKERNGTFYLTFPTHTNITDYFHFTNTGVIYTKIPLDRELIDQHEFNVSATDMGGLSSTVLVIINVVDDNDNRPEVIFPLDNIQRLPVTSLPGTVVAQVLAEDRDIDQNSLLRYEVVQNNATFPYIFNNFVGKLILNGTVSSSDVGLVVHFLIRVTDHGTPPLQSVTAVNIQITSGELYMEPSTAGIQSNLVIIIVIVAVTVVLSAIMVVVILKICWVGRRKAGSRTSSNIILESDEVNPKLINSSSSASSTSSTDSNGNEKLKVEEMYQSSDDGSHGFHGYQKRGGRLGPGLEESGSELNMTLSSTLEKKIEDRLYMEKVKEVSYDMQKRSDETNSDNSGEMGTRDSGQGGSDVDLNSLSELPVLDMPDAVSYSEEPTSHSRQTYLTEDTSDSNHSNGNQDNDVYVLPDSIHRNNETPLETTRGSYSVPPLRTAERKELSKLKRGQKRVMFSDDLENSHSSERSSNMSSLSYSDLVQNAGLSQQLNRMYSHEPTKTSDKVRNGVPPHRSVDNLIVDSIHGNKFVRLPSYQNRFNVPAQLPVSQQSKTANDSNGWQNTLGNLSVQTNDSGISVAPDYQRSVSSRENDSTSTSGSYNLTNDEFSLSPTDSVFPSDLYV